jgi:hypothetical protein
MLAVIGAVGEAEREAMLERPCHDIEGQERGPLQGPCTTARRQAGEIMRLRQQGAGAAEIARSWVSVGASMYRVLSAESHGFAVM